MMAKKSKRPSWFKLFLHQKPIIDSVPDEVVGQAIKAAFHYFATKEELQLDALPMVVYSSFKPYIEESFTDYERDVRNGHKGGRPQKPPVTPGKGGLPPPTQAEAEEYIANHTHFEKTHLQIIESKGKFRISAAGFNKYKEALQYMDSIRNDVPIAKNAWIMCK